MVVVAGHPRAPVVVVERVAERTAEAVTARLGDDVDDAAGEPAVLGRDAIGRDHRLLHRILYIEVVGLAAEVLVNVDAIDEIQRLKGHRAGNRVAAVWSRRMHARRLEHDGIDVTRRRQHRHQLLLEVGGDLRRVRQHLAGAGPNRDVLGERRRTERRVQRERLAQRDRDRLLLTLESAQLEGHGVGAGRNPRHDVIAVLRRHGCQRALQVGTSDRHRDTGQRQSLAVDDSSRDRAGRRLRRCA